MCNLDIWIFVLFVLVYLDVCVLDFVCDWGCVWILGWGWKVVCDGGIVDVVEWCGDGFEWNWGCYGFSYVWWVFGGR